MSDWRTAMVKLEGAYSDSTLRGYQADMEQFLILYVRNKCEPLPASPSTIVNYVNEEAARLRPSSIKRRLSGIGRIHRLLRHDDPTRDEDVQLALRRARRKSRPVHARRWV